MVRVVLTDGNVITHKNETHKNCQYDGKCLVVLSEDSVNFYNINNVAYAVARKNDQEENGGKS